ncbi:Large ribosomal subunit protein uL10m [Nakaseomyces bracarensis]|uniref:Large ribosomal subunit protein uL10m n=1 Tax=Nakaseomyces bracarensis TaxID=273131 RepID=A0ABR4NQ31_9SACH
MFKSGVSTLWQCVRQYSVPVRRETIKPLESRKTFLLDSYRHMMDNNSMVLFAHYNNLTKNEDHHFREQIRQAGGRLTRIRNNILKVCLRTLELPDPCVKIRDRKSLRKHPLLPLLKGPTATISFKETDPQQVAKLFKVLKNAQDKLFIMGAQIDKDIYDSNKLDQFKSLPSKPVLQGQLVGMLQMLGGAGLVQVLDANKQHLYLTLKAHEENMKEE